MKDDPTIFGDRETVELLSAQPELLAIADAVRATQRKEARAAPRVRLLLAAAAVAGLSAAFAFAFTGGSGGQRITVDRGHALVIGGPMMACPVIVHPCFDNWGLPFTYAITRTNGAVSAIAVTVNGRGAGGTAEIRVVQGDAGGAGQTVFSEQVSLTEVPATSSGPTGQLPPVVSSWSGTLSPNDWNGGCQDAQYSIAVSVSPPSTGAASGPTGEASGTTGAAPVVAMSSPSFNCQHAPAPVVGPTGGSGPTGGQGTTGSSGPTGGG